MGQKAIPTGLRLGVIRTWNSKWYAEGKQYQDLIYEDLLLRRYIKKRLQHAAISSVGIERTVKKVTVNIFTARPGIVIGKKGEEVERLKGEIQHLTGKEIYINIREIKRPETDAALVAENIAKQLEKRVAFRRTMKKAISTQTHRGGLLGTSWWSGNRPHREVPRRTHPAAHSARGHRLRHGNGSYHFRLHRSEGLDLQGRDHPSQPQRRRSRPGGMIPC